MRIIGLMAALVLVVFATHDTLAQEGDSILVDEYVTSQDFVEAVVTRVRPQARTITVRGENRGMTRTFSVPDGTRISVNGRDARLRDIRTGDSVRIAMKPRADEVVVATLQVPETTRTLEQRRSEPVAAESTATMLPNTASNQHLFLLFGLIATLVAGSLRLVRG